MVDGSKSSKRKLKQNPNLDGKTKAKLEFELEKKIIQISEKQAHFLNQQF